jgi:hypothetical protein
MIPIPTGVRFWIATGHTDMRVSQMGNLRTRPGEVGCAKLSRSFEDWFQPCLLAVFSHC